MRPRASLAAVLALGLLACAGSAPTSAPAEAKKSPGPVNPSDFLTVERGTLPIVVSVPHGGTDPIPGVPVRSGGTTTLDTHTAELALALQARLQARLGGRAHLVLLRASRAHLDVNRSADLAYESPAVAPLYDAYHAALRDAVGTAGASTRALLVDVHGQSQNVQVTYRGTRDGLTADLEALHAPAGFLGHLVAGGFDLAPGSTRGAEHPSFNGGFIVGTYGRQAPGGVNAVQLEFGYTLRAAQADWEATADRIAASLAAHLQAP